MRRQTMRYSITLALWLAVLQMVAGVVHAEILDTGQMLERRVPAPAAGHEWTPWLNRDSPSGSGDFETLEAFVEAGEACSTPREVECLAVDGRDWTDVKQVYTCDATRGGICVNADQRPGERCLDYRVRFLCPAPVTPPEDDFRRKAERLEPLLEAARTGKEEGPFSGKQLVRWYNSWKSRVGREGTFEEYPAALFAWAADTAEPGEAELAGRGTFQGSGNCDRCVVQGRWVYRGPDGLETQNQGVVSAIWVAPDDPDQILAGAASGLWATKDGGATWKNLTGTSKHLKLVGVLDIAVNPKNQKEIFIGTGLGLSFSDLNRSYGFGVFRTRNGGQTWTRAPLADLAAKRFPASHRVLFHSQNPQIVYAALGAEVYKSVDGGNTWSQLFEASAGGKGLPVRDLAIRPVPGGDDEVYVATNSEHKGYISDPQQCSTQDPSTYVWATFDKSYCEIRHTARVWKLTTPPLQTNLSSPPTDLTGTIADYESATTLTAVEVTPAGVVVATHAGLMGGAGQAKVVLYKEAGSAWTKVSSNLGTGVNYGYTLKLATSKTDTDVLYLSGLLLMKSTDGGATFSTMGQGYWSFLSDGRWSGSHPDVRAIALQGQSAEGDIVYFGTDGGVSRTRDGLQSTENLNGHGLHLAEVHGIGISDSRPGLVVFGTQHNGFFTNRDYAWALDPGGDFYDTALFESADDEVTALTTMNAPPVRTSKDAELPLAYESCPESTCSNAEVAVAGDSVYLGRRSLWRRPVTGGGWLKVADLPGCTVSGMAPSVDGDILYVACGGPLWSTADPATFQGKFYRITLPAGNSPVVSDITSGLSAVAWQPITDVATNADGSVAYVSLGAFGEGVFRYQVGASWTSFAGGLPPVPVNALEYDRDGDTLFAGTDVGVFVKTPHSKGWSNFSSAAPFTLVSDLEIDRTTRTLVASTFGYGVWAAVLPTANDFRAYCRPVVIDDSIFDPKDAPW